MRTVRVPALLLALALTTTVLARPQDGEDPPVELRSEVTELRAVVTDAVLLAGLSPGVYELEVEVAGPGSRPLERQRVEFGVE